MRKNYELPEDFLSDESFLSYLHGDQESSEEWKEWLAANPEKLPASDEAIRLFRALDLGEIPVTNEKINIEAAKLNDRLAGKRDKGKIVSMSARTKWLWSAAAVLFLACSAMWFYSQNNGEKILSSNFGEITKNKLPDGTEVILNANSEVIFDKKWKETKTREVWIKGEAFFHVKKTAHHDKFIVHTTGFDIEVTGTSFNVINTDEISSIVLKEGRVIIHRKGQEDMVLSPGESVEYANHKIDKSEIDDSDYMAWTENKLVFENNTIGEVAKIITRHYGKKVRIDDKEIEAKTVTGVMPNNNLEVLISALNATGEFRVVLTGDTLEFTSLK